MFCNWHVKKLSVIVYISDCLLNQFQAWLKTRSGGRKTLHMAAEYRRMVQLIFKQLKDFKVEQLIEPMLS